MMTTDDGDLRQFLSDRHPFDKLPEAELSALNVLFDLARFETGREILGPGQPNEHLYCIRTGAVEIRDTEDNLQARLGEGDLFGGRSLLSSGTVDATFRAIENVVLYTLPAESFHALYRKYPQFRYFFDPVRKGRLKDAVETLVPSDNASVNLMVTTTAEIASHNPVTLPPDANIREAARRMTEEGISSLMVAESGKLVGIVTDRDLRSRVIAAGLDYDRPIGEIMSASPVSIDADSYAYEALMTMARNGVHHLPMVDGDAITGMITDTDLVQRYSTSPLYLIGDVYQSKSVADLVATSKRLSQLLCTLVDANASAQSVGQAITSLGEAITCRLLALAEAELGSAPIPFAWLAGGSQARREQTAHSDQDNCLLLDDAYDPETHGDYFEALSRFVCDALDACGYVYCPGEIMAMTDRWRQPLEVWKGYFDSWIDQPKPDALLNASVFFDLRCLYGERALFDELQAHVLPKAKGNKIFLAFMAANAQQFQPPLGFFRNFVLIKGGEHDHTLDLKQSGVVPIIDLARVYSLAGGTSAVNTRDRLDAAAASKSLSRRGADDLRDALEFINTVRLRNQAQQIKDGRPADNFMAPEDLSHFERGHLKEAFSAVRTMQTAMGQRYQTARFG